MNAHAGSTALNEDVMTETSEAPFSHGLLRAMCMSRADSWGENKALKQQEALGASVEAKLPGEACKPTIQSL